KGQFGFSSSPVASETASKTGIIATSLEQGVYDAQGASYLCHVCPGNGRHATGPRAPLLAGGHFPGCTARGHAPGGDPGWPRGWPELRRVLSGLLAPVGLHGGGRLPAVVYAG